MHALDQHTFSIREVSPAEFGPVGETIVAAYAGLPGMPGPDEQPEYYALLRDVGRRAANPAIQVFVAVDAWGDLLGSVDFISDMRQYGSGGSAGAIEDAAGVRLLAVGAEHRGKGVGRRLTGFCIERARALGRSRVILHTTRTMAVAWPMYERMGFVRLPEIDFQQGALPVFGFELRLDP